MVLKTNKTMLKMKNVVIYIFIIFTSCNFIHKQEDYLLVDLNTGNVECGDTNYYISSVEIACSTEVLPRVIYQPSANDTLSKINLFSCLDNANISLDSVFNQQDEVQFYFSVQMDEFINMSYDFKVSKNHFEEGLDTLLLYNMY